MAIKLLIADEHEVMRRGLVAMLASDDIKIMAEAANGSDTLSFTAQHRPDVVMIDVHLPFSDGLDVLEKMRKLFPLLPVVMLSLNSNPTYVAQAAARGASDFLLKGANRREIVSAIVAAANGDGPTVTGELHHIINTLARNSVPEDDDVQLTARESQVLRHIAMALNNKEIGDLLSISIETVQEHVQHMLRKLAMTNRTQAAVWALRKGLV